MVFVFTEPERECMFESMFEVMAGPLFFKMEDGVESVDVCKDMCLEDLSCDIITTLRTETGYTCRFYKNEHLKVERTSEPYTFWTKRCPHGKIALDIEINPHWLKNTGNFSRESCKSSKQTSA